MTIKDIARESGYAVGTVSRALNNAPGVSAETRQKILEIVNRHNYEPNANAKHLKQQTNDGIAMIVKGTQNMLFAGILEPLHDVIQDIKDGFKCRAFLRLQFAVFFVTANPVRQECH